MDVSAVLINKLLKERSLDVWSKLKLAFLDPTYSGLYTHINKYYTNYSVLPSFDDLELVVRDLPVSKTLAILRLVDDADVTAEVALDALIDQYTQNLCIDLLEKYIDKLPIYDTLEIKENLANIVLTLDEKTLSTEGVFAMNEMSVFVRPDELMKNRVHLGLNNTCDSVLGGVARQELILIGGKRGSGKSITCSNLMVNQYEMGNTSVYFTIEMVAQETLQRNISILANINHVNLKNNKLTDTEMLAIIKARAGMFTDAEPYVQEFLQSRDQYKFEEDINKHCALKEAQMIIIDDRALSISSLDLHLGKVKAKHGERFTLAIVDYLNQVVVEGGQDQFDWKPQIVISKKMKELARKHDIVIVSPYQIDDNGGTRFAKGILDAADIAFLMEAHDKEAAAISFETTKIRGAKEMKFTSGMDWDSLRISPVSVEKPAAKEKASAKDKIPRAGAEVVVAAEPSNDLPWDT